MISGLFKGKSKVRSNECKVCGKISSYISGCLGVCIDCLRDEPKASLPIAKETHARIRSYYNLPANPPKSSNGIQCKVCANECKIGEGEISFCGLKRNVEGRLESLTNPRMGILHYYLDSQVTNCCASWFCPAGTGAGYPKYAYKRGAEYGYYNLAVFFYGCNFDCLFCQNNSHKNVLSGQAVSVERLVGETRRNRSISCWCFFGGSPEPQLPFAIKASTTVMEETPNRLLRICFEWNGCGNTKLVRNAAELSLISGGNIKFDLKCFNTTVSYALSGVPNTKAYENFKLIAQEFYPQRPNLPLLTATTLLVPGYVDEKEVEGIAGFIADLNPEIPYSLLVFHPDFMMPDLPKTSLMQAVECYQAAKKHLVKVNVGNLQTLGIRSMEDFKRSAYS